MQDASGSGAGEERAIAAIGPLGQRELAAVKAWIASGCEGPRPVPDAAERERLTDDLMRAINAREEGKRT
jgi:hypothetical protein